MKPTHRITYIFFKVLAFCTRKFPAWLLKFQSIIFFLFLFYIIPIRKTQVYTNLKIAFPDKSDKWCRKTAKNCYKYFIGNFMDFFAFPNSFRNANIHVKGNDLLDNALKQKNGVILVSGHFGAWEILSAWLGDNNYPITAVAAKQKNRGSDRFFQEQRSQFGMQHIYRRSSLDNMYNILEENKILGLVSDQDAKKRGVFVNFFNQKTSTPKGAARFHLKTVAPIIFAICHQNNPNDFTIEFQTIKVYKDDTIESITQTYTSILESYIRRYPEQYFWFHRRWKSKF